MADPLWGQQMTNMWMLDPYMFDPTQKSNIFSDYNDLKLQAQGPSYNTGAGGPTNAMGQPIPAFQAWQAANPAGMTMNNTPPQQAPALQQQGQNQVSIQGGRSIPSIYNSATPNLSRGIYSASPSGNGYGLTMGQPYALSSFAAPGSYGNQNQADAAGLASLMGFNPQRMNGLSPQQAAPAPQGAAQTPTAPNNWMTALNALSQPGNPVTPGATVPMAQGYQPAGGVNSAFLSQVAPGMNQNFLSALAAIQGRPQGQQQRRTG